MKILWLCVDVAYNSSPRSAAPVSPISSALCITFPAHGGNRRQYLNPLSQLMLMSLVKLLRLGRDIVRDTRKTESKQLNVDLFLQVKDLD